MSTRSITMPDRELSFVKRHFGTDVLAAGWLLLLATFFYTAFFKQSSTTSRLM